jgi:hypothetical protein
MAAPTSAASSESYLTTGSRPHMALLDVFADLQLGPFTSAQRTSASLNGDQRIYELAMLSGTSSDTSSLSFGPFASLRPSAATNES